MNDEIAQKILDKIIGQVFGYKNPFTLEQFQQKFAFDVRLPVKVNDSTTGETTWAQSVTSGKFITMINARRKSDLGEFVLPKEPIKSIEDLLRIWEKTNYVSTERQTDSMNVAQSDNILNSENIYRSMDIRGSKNILFSDGAGHSEFVAASQRSSALQYCIRVDDSRACSDCFTVAWSGKIVNSMFINDCFDLYECLFCTNIATKKYWIANMPFEEKEYFDIKDMVIRWVLSQ